MKSTSILPYAYHQLQVLEKETKWQWQVIKHLFPANVYESIPRCANVDIVLKIQISSFSAWSLNRRIKIRTIIIEFIPPVSQRIGMTCRCLLTHSSACFLFFPLRSEAIRHATGIIYFSTFVDVATCFWFFIIIIRLLISLIRN